MKKYGLSLSELINVASSPECCYPLMLAIELNQPTIVKSLLKLGADPSVRDMNGNNAMHYAALASVQMIEIIWENTHSKELLNSLNNAGSSPIVLAIRNANPRCLTTLLGFGAELNIRGAGKNALFEVMQSKGKGIEVLKPLLEASPNLLTERDTATGNTVLHAALFKTPLAALLCLKKDELDINAKNDTGQTALHIYTHRGDIGMIMTLSSYNCDLDAVNSNGNTALHVAVSNKYLEVTRLLLCLGANPNVTNNHGDTPRHLAARLQEWDLLKSLVICGAKRCAAGKIGCVSGCVNERAQRLLEKNSSSKGPGDLVSPRSFASIEQVERGDTCSSEQSTHPLQDFQQNIIYDHMMDKLQQLAERKEDNKNIINLLSLDGGGIRGLVSIQILMHVEKILGEPIISYFDWCAGTSTGALIVAALSAGKNLRDCQLIYLRFKDLIFDGWARPYNSNVLEQFIQKEMGENTTMADLKWPRMMISTVRADCFPVRLEFIRNYRLPLGDAENDQLGYTEPGSVHVWKALRRSSAAPTYFSSSDNYIDGGIISNNPTLDLLSEVQLWNETNRYLNTMNTKFSDALCTGDETKLHFSFSVFVGDVVRDEEGRWETSKVPFYEKTLSLQVLQTSTYYKIFEKELKKEETTIDLAGAETVEEWLANQVFKINENNDGTFAVIDGYLRLRAVKLTRPHNWMDLQVKCEVYKNIDLREVAALRFRPLASSLQKANTRPFDHTTMVDWIVTVMPELPRERTALKEHVEKIIPFFKIQSQAQIKAFPSETALEYMLSMFNDNQKKQYLPKILDAFEKCKKDTNFSYGIYTAPLWRRMAALFDLDNNTKIIANKSKTTTSLATMRLEEREKLLNQFLEEVPKQKGRRGLENLLLSYTDKMGLYMTRLSLSTSSRGEFIDEMFSGQKEEGLERLQAQEPETIADDLGEESIVSSITAPVGNDLERLDVSEPLEKPKKLDSAQTHLNRKRKRVENEKDADEPAPKTSSQVPVRTRKTCKTVEAHYKKLLEEKENQIEKLKKLLTSANVPIPNYL
ncbi:hypothetical protein QR680_001929 [Steinernema hermaphroditum]|uniref:phospholipase A2 n=1 Tax=Steinernema hermaphroditum TaxID=289476 RepID=A0AA39LH25_9BILA|nr:hypothetical protein QR680_001929 [Steinernema hermaphroditum]